MKSAVLLDREAGQEPNYGATKSSPILSTTTCDDQSRHGSVSLGKTADGLPPKTAEKKDAKCGRRVRKFLWILPLVHSEFWIAAGFSLLQSFYPAMASDKGLDADEYSYVYSAYKIAMMFGAILAERIAHDPKEVTMNYTKLLLDPMFIAGLGCMVLCWGQMGFNEPTLEPSLREIIASGGLASYIRAAKPELVECPASGHLLFLVYSNE
ncbi:hypothetical protein HPB49_013961 [Dermacentor silvarum]|uniref:Uncharacterized protein n=1 Tax=Dermacentor silvarum TaxID=543639 RepID=A0ACB8C9T7_DERSI|nr:hypothetical protein HPB49_013961 [Dermacentor silvarum]